ncbi:MAG: IMP dehydrogenase [Patescibacteria group bacterium]|nr:IMP dehydrogenase [Patescibacteria group bacterium]
MYVKFPHFLNYDDVLIVPENNENEEYRSRHQINLVADAGKFKGYIPIIASNMSTIGTFEVAGVLSRFGMLTALHKFYTYGDYVLRYDHGMNVMISCGLKEKEYETLKKVLAEFPIQFINLDVANGYMLKFAKFVEKVKKEFPDKVVIAGNVATPDGVRRLVDHGADLVKVGIGNGSVCMTRHMTGVGVPQLSAVLECSDYADIIADGGFKFPGDIAKAFWAGASGVMVGSLFANTKETGTSYYGMSSRFAQQKYEMYGDYKAGEGKVVEFVNDERIELREAVYEILGGLRSSLSYCNCMKIGDFIGKRRFVIANHIYNDKWQNMNLYK